MDYSDNNKQIAQILYEKMKTLPIGTEISVSELSLIALEEHQTEDGFPMFDLWNVMNALRYMMNKERKLRMDFTKHEFLCEGLPFNIPFVLLKWGNVSIQKRHVLQEVLLRETACMVLSLCAISMKNGCFVLQMNLDWWLILHILQNI